jgi:hypothetical protein
MVPDIPLLAAAFSEKNRPDIQLLELVQQWDLKSPFLGKNGTSDHSATN